MAGLVALLVLGVVLVGGRFWFAVFRIDHPNDLRWGGKWNLGPAREDDHESKPLKPMGPVLAVGIVLAAVAAVAIGSRFVPEARAGWAGLAGLLVIGAVVVFVMAYRGGVPDEIDPWDIRPKRSPQNRRALIGSLLVAFAGVIVFVSQVESGGNQDWWMTPTYLLVGDLVIDPAAVAWREQHPRRPRGVAD